MQAVGIDKLILQTTAEMDADGQWTVWYIFCPQDAVGAQWTKPRHLRKVWEMYAAAVESCPAELHLWANCECMTVARKTVPFQSDLSEVGSDVFRPDDADEDREINLRDVVLITRWLADGWDVTINRINADVNRDDVVDLKDAVLIRRYLAGGWGVTLI